MTPEEQQEALEIIRMLALCAYPPTIQMPPVSYNMSADEFDKLCEWLCRYEIVPTGWFSTPHNRARTFMRSYKE